MCVCVSVCAQMKHNPKPSHVYIYIRESATLREKTHPGPGILIKYYILKHTQYTEHQHHSHACTLHECPRKKLYISMCVNLKGVFFKFNYSNYVGKYLLIKQRSSKILIGVSCVCTRRIHFS